jgi:hypothetical protein
MMALFHRFTMLRLCRICSIPSLVNAGSSKNLQDVLSLPKSLFFAGLPVEYSTLLGLCVLICVAPSQRLAFFSKVAVKPYSQTHVARRQEPFYLVSNIAHLRQPGAAIPNRKRLGNVFPNGRTSKEAAKLSLFGDEDVLLDCTAIVAVKQVLASVSTVSHAPQLT